MQLVSKMLNHALYGRGKRCTTDVEHLKKYFSFSENAGKIQPRYYIIAILTTIAMTLTFLALLL